MIVGRKKVFSWNGVSLVGWIQSVSVRSFCMLWKTLEETPFFFLPSFLQRVQGANSFPLQMAPLFKGRKRRTRDYQHLPPLVAKMEGFSFFFFSFPKRAVGADRWMKETIEAREWAPPAPRAPSLHTHTCTHTHNSFFFHAHVIAIHFIFTACVFSIELNCFYSVISLYWERGTWRREEGGGVPGVGGGGAHMANTKKNINQRWLKLNLYSAGSGLTKLKVRESNSRGWYVMWRGSPLGSSGTCLRALPTLRS